MKRLFIEKLINWQKKKLRKPLLIRGVRQVGKTYILEVFGRQCFAKSYVFNFERDRSLHAIFDKDLKPERIIQELSLKLDQPIDIERDLIIFDEIQECPKALTSLKYFAEYDAQCFVCAAGSLLGLHLNEGSFPVGKVTIETLRPMSFEEFLMAADDQALRFLKGEEISEYIHEHLWEKLKHYMITGGLPEAVKTYVENKDDLFRAFKEIRKKQDDLLKAYHADIAKHAGKINAMHIERIFKAVPAQLSRAQDRSTNRFKFKGVVPGVSHYDRLVGAIDWLEAAGMIIKIPIVNCADAPLASHTKENIFKLMLFDIGLLGAMCDLHPKKILETDYGSYKGYFAENLIAQQLQLELAEGLYCWQEGKSEVEFLTQLIGDVTPIEVKSGWVTRAKSLKTFQLKYRPKKCIIYSAKPPHYDSATSTQFIPLYCVLR